MTSITDKLQKIITIFKQVSRTFFIRKSWPESQCWADQEAKKQNKNTDFISDLQNIIMSNYMIMKEVQGLQYTQEWVLNRLLKPTLFQSYQNTSRLQFLRPLISRGHWQPWQMLHQTSHWRLNSQPSRTALRVIFRLRYLFFSALSVTACASASRFFC